MGPMGFIGPMSLISPIGLISSLFTLHPSLFSSLRQRDLAHAVVAGVHILAQKAQDAEEHRRRSLEQVVEPGDVDKSEVAGGADGGGVVVSAMGEDGAQSDDLSGIGHAQRLGPSVLCRENEIDGSGVNDVDTTGIFALTALTTGATSACESSGASTMPSTRRVMKFSTT